MRVLSIYNRYLNRGGEDEVFESDLMLLVAAGHEVVPLTVRTRVPEGPLDRARFAAETIWSRQWRRRMDSVLSACRPDVVHVYNLFPRLSPSIYYACRDAGVPLVQTVQNFRLVCPRATLFRDGSVCESCLGRVVPWPGVVHACYHDSRAQTAVVASMLVTHRLLHTFRDRVQVYVAATEFSRRKLVEGGLPRERVTCRPNFRMTDPGPRGRGGEGALFVGRLSAEKGVETLLEAWRESRVPLRIAGDGPLAEACQRASSQHPSIEYLGRVDNERVIEEMKQASFLVFPSQWYEGLPMTIIESFACGLPVVASRLGAMEEVIDSGRNGWLFEPGEPTSLRERLEWLTRHPDETSAAGLEARSDFEKRYTPEVALESLLAIYRTAQSRV